MSKNLSAISVHERRKEAVEILKKYPDRVPIIFSPCESSKYNSELTDTQFIIPKMMTVGQFIFFARKRMSLSAEKAVFIFIHGFIPPASALMCDIYDYHRDSDYFLHITYSFENTFGYG
jgi:GABA(A) receptor-associated protein